MKRKNLNDDVAQKTAQMLIKIGIVNFRFDPPYTFVTGIKSPVYLDNRILMSFPKERMKIVDFYIQVIKKNIGVSNIDCVSATAMGAIPLGAWVADRLKVPLVYVRARAKAHGKQNKLEGAFKKGYRTLIVEDHISTASSSLNNADTIRQLGGKVKYCIGLTTYESFVSKSNFKKSKIKPFVLTTGHTIADEALKKKIITEKQRGEIHEWFEDPIKWADERGYNDAD